MKIIDVEQNSEAWLDLRKGKITGSKFKGILVKRGTGHKLGFYELMAEKIALKEEHEDPMERGHRLENEALDKFEDVIGYKIERVGLCVHDKYPDIALSPDGLIIREGYYSEAVEIKCLSSARHLEAHFEKQIPDEYFEQVVQYFIVNEKLKVLHFVFYDPRITVLPIFEIKVKREEVKDKVIEYFEYQKNALAEINDLLEELTF